MQLSVVFRSLQIKSRDACACRCCVHWYFLFV